jgi:hypothetical protein
MSRLSDNLSESFYIYQGQNEEALDKLEKLLELKQQHFGEQSQEVGIIVLSSQLYHQ